MDYDDISKTVIPLFSYTLPTFGEIAARGTPSFPTLEKTSFPSFGLRPFVPDETSPVSFFTAPYLLCNTYCEEEDSIECDPVLCQWLDDSFEYYEKLNDNQKQLISHYISGLTSSQIHNDFINGTISKNVSYYNLKNYIDIYSIIKGAPPVPKDINVTRHIYIPDEKKTLSCDKTNLPPKNLPHMKPIATSIEKAFPIRFSIHNTKELACCFLNIKLKKGDNAFFLGPPPNYKNIHVAKSVNKIIQYEIVLLPSMLHINNNKNPEMVTINNDYVRGLNKLYQTQILSKFENRTFSQYNCTIEPLEIEILWDNHTNEGMVYDLKHICSQEHKDLIKNHKKISTSFNLYHKKGSLFHSIENYSREFSVLNKTFMTIIYKQDMSNGKVRIYKGLLEHDYALGTNKYPLNVNNQEISFTDVIGIEYQQYKGGKATRPSPDIHAADTPLGTVKKGNNGAYWIVLENAKKIHRWVELGDKFESYDCLYNGELNKAFIGHKNIYIFSTIEESITKLAYTIPKYTRFWVSSASWVVPPKKKTKGYKGSTLLIEIKPKSYIYIDGRIIQSFSTDSPILKYDSPMGNSFVPYGYAVTKDKTYLMLESVWVEWNGKGDPYELVYNKKTNGVRFAMKTLFDAWKK